MVANALWIRVSFLPMVVLTVAVWAADASAQDPASTATPPQDAAAEAQPGQQITGDELNAMLSNAEELLRQGDFAQAALEFGRAIEPSSGFFNQGVALFFVRAYTGQGRALAGLQEYEDALEAFKQVLDLYENYAQALIGRGYVYLEMNQPDSALADFEKAMKNSRTPEDVLEASFGLGKSQVLVGDFLGGIKNLSRVIAQGQNTHMAEAYRLRGVSQGQLDRFAAAADDLRQAIAADPEEHEGYFQMGVLNLRQKEYQAAIDEFARAIEKYTPPPGGEDQPYTQGRLVKSSAHIELGKAATDEATRKAAYQAAIDEAQTLYNSVDEESRYTASIRAAALLSRGIGERMLGQLSTAIRTFSQTLELNPAISEAYFRRGICLLAIGEERMAIADFTQAAAINFEDPRNNLWEGFVYAKMGDYHEAIRAYGDAIAASDRFTPAYINRGLAYMVLGDFDKAVADFNEALRVEPTNGDYYFKRGVAYLHLGDLQRAADSLASAIEYAPAHRDAYRYLGDVMQRLGRTELANQYRQRAAELEPQPGAQAPPSTTN